MSPPQEAQGRPKPEFFQQEDTKSRSLRELREERKKNRTLWRVAAVASTIATFGAAATAIDKLGVVQFSWAWEKVDHANSEHKRLDDRITSMHQDIADRLDEILLRVKKK